MTQSLYLVAGLGQTGLSIAGYLQRRGLPFVVFDSREHVDNLAEFQARFSDISVFLGSIPDSLYAQLIEIIASPGVGLTHPVMQRAIQQGIPVIGDIECLAREIKATNQNNRVATKTTPIIAITGTNGKSTVTTLVGEMAKRAGLKVAVAGNIGQPVLDLLDNDKTYALWVLELSSFQLELTYSLSPLAATVLNLSPDHLDRHMTFFAYSEAKQRIYHEAQTQIYNRDDNATYPKETTAENLISFGLSPPLRENDWGIMQHDGVYFLCQGARHLLSVEALALKGKHNWQNALAACALATVAGIDSASIQTVLSTFTGLPHRCQWVRTHKQVDWINDSKGTNVGATSSAISGVGGHLKGKIVLLAGGIGKGADFQALRSPVGAFVRCIILFGEAAAQIAEAMEGVVPTYRVNSLQEAVIRAETEAQPHDVVLLSPACASQDMFRDFNHRGESFVAEVNLL